MTPPVTEPPITSPRQAQPDPGPEGDAAVTEKARCVSPEIGPRDEAIAGVPRPVPAGALPALFGGDLARLRRRAGLTQAQLARAAGVGRRAVGYWERKARVETHGWAPRRMLDVLGVERQGAETGAKEAPEAVAIADEAQEAEEPVSSRGAVSRPTTHARGDGVLPIQGDRADPAMAAAIARETARLKAKAAARLSRRRVVCGAKTRKGTACRNLSEPGRARCKFHGGNSTGPRTPEGRARIAEAQRRRWQRWWERASDGQERDRRPERASEGD